MFGMKNLTNQTLHCMPWPEQVSLPTGRTTPLGRHDSATVIQVAGDPTGRLTRYAQQVLGSFAVGILDITVAAQDPELTPFLQMDPLGIGVRFAASRPSLSWLCTISCTPVCLFRISPALSGAVCFSMWPGISFRLLR